MSSIGSDFNLIESPWISVLRHDGRTEDVSLLDVIARADEFTQLVGEVPTQVFAIQRLILAVLHRAVDGPEDVEHWREIAHGWPGVVVDVERYLRKFDDRFFLFHSVHPFFQVADLRTSKGDISGLEKLIVDVPNGAPFFTTRIGPGLQRISFPEAARWLVHVQAFDPSGIRSGAVGDPRVKGGRGYPIGTSWAGQIGGISVVGDNLRETLIFNLVAASAPEIDLVSGPQDLPPWERPPLTAAVEDLPGRPEPRGLVELYTWQSRRVRLARDDDSVVGLVLAQGDPMTLQNRQDVEPMTSWRFSEPQTKKHGHVVYMPLQHEPERQFWRGLSGLLPHAPQEPVRGQARFQIPAIVRWLEHVRAELGFPDRVIRLRATGIKYGGQNATVDEIVDDVLALPLTLLDEGAAEFEAMAVDAVRQAEGAANAVRRLARNLALAAGSSLDNGGPADRAGEEFYAALDMPFRQWLAGLTLDEPVLSASKRWQRNVRDRALEIGDELLSSAGPAAWVGRDIKGRQGERHIDSGRADAWFRSALAKALPGAYDDDRKEVAS